MDYKTFLNASKLKATQPRLQLMALLEQRGHLTIEAIYQSLKPDSPLLSLSTVYNNLIALCRNKVVREVAIAGSAEVYEIAKAEHAHLICKQCGEVLDLECSFSAVKDSLKLPRGARLESGDLVFSGVCAKCADAYDETCGENYDEIHAKIHGKNARNKHGAADQASRL